MPKCVGLLSGGLDSAIACAMMKAQGLDVHAVFIHMPWGCGHLDRAQRVADELGIPLKVIPIADDYLDLLSKPKYGFGSAINPCVDCHIYMVQKAADYMRELDAAFVFTGEVVGQRPMSQRRVCLKWVEDGAGLSGRLLRPLSALHLDPTVPETEGVVDRSRLLALDGRSRKVQFEMARQFGLKHHAWPGGGCLLTEKHFAARLKDVLGRGCDSIAETAVLGIGRYFRLDEKAFVIMGRDDKENEQLIHDALPTDLLLRPATFPGPVALLRGREDEGAQKITAGLIQYYSKWREKDPQPVTSWRSVDPGRHWIVCPCTHDAVTVETMLDFFKH